MRPDTSPRKPSSASISNLTIQAGSIRADDVAAELKSPTGKSRLAKSRLATADTVRADVAVDGGTEMYSWVGESHYTGPEDAIQFATIGIHQFLLDGAVTIGGVSSLGTHNS